MKPILMLCAVLALAVTAACATKTEHELSTPTGVLADFRARVDAYVALQRKQVTGAGVQPQRVAGDRTDDARKVIAERMRSERAGAKQGDIFTPEISAAIRERLDREVRGAASAGTRSAIRDDAPAVFPLRVNMEFPSGSLPTMPGNVIAALPSLPAGLDYRIVGTNLILRDTIAHIVVDYMVNVMCEKC